jgi:serine protease Do
MTISRVVLFVFTMALACRDASEGTAAQQAPAASTVNTSANVSATRRTAITSAVARVAPAVVTVQTESVERVPVDPFDMFFGGGGSGARVSPGLGTGFVMRSDGVIVTNAHVVSGASTVSVMMRDGKVFPARVLGADETNDLAVLKIEARDLPVATIGNSNNLLVGEWAIAIGNPYGFLLGNSEPSVSAGVISAVGRNLVAPGEGSAAYFDMIQTDAAINPGNSGGPLVNADGEVIGVNSSIYSPSGGSVGLGFAIPVNRVMRVVDDLVSHGAVRRPWIGVQLRHVNSRNPRDVIAAGAVVESVIPGSPAARSGLQPGDVILRVGNRAIRNEYDWQASLLDLRVGERARLQVRRGSREMALDVSISDLPEVTAPKVQVLRELELTTLTAAIRAERQIRSSRGALVTNLSERMSAELGIQQGDVIVAVNRTQVASADDVARALDYYGGRGPIRVYLERSGRLFFTDFVIR